MKKTLTFALLMGATIFGAKSQEYNIKKLDSFFNILSDANRSMGSFAISKNGKIIYQRSIGSSDLSNKIPASSNTPYRIGSVTKIFTATMIFQLIDEGKLSLETKLSKYFREIPGAEKISIGQMLTHSSGLMDYVNDVADKSWITVPHQKSELIDTIAYHKLHFEPGTQQQYSNSGYLLLSYIIEKITGTSYNKTIEKKIINKLRLKNTFSGIPNKKGRNEAIPYDMENNWTEVKDIYFPNVIGVGDVLSTPSDLLIFINALSNGKLVSASSYDKMREFNGNNAFGMGLIRVPFYGQLGLGHNGGTYGSYSVVYQFKESGIAIATCVNALDFPLNDISIALLSSVNNKPFDMPNFKQIDIKEEELVVLEGIYATDLFPLKITITKNVNKLIGQATGQAPFPLEAVSKNTFKNDKAALKLEFNSEKKQMTLYQGGKNYLFTKQ